jgi:hypothetical protein
MFKHIGFKGLLAIMVWNDSFARLGGEKRIEISIWRVRYGLEIKPPDIAI